MADDAVYVELRPLLFSIAYRMVASASEAEDIVQEAFLRYHRAVDETCVETPRAYLSAITTRLSIDHLRSARTRRETYVGTWLPEPLVTAPSTDPNAQAELADSLSIAFLMVLDALSPIERAVFLLREVFGYTYEETAHAVGKTEANCRQLLVRAKRHIEERRPTPSPSRARREMVTDRFMQACFAGNEADLMALLAADVVTYTDGGGKAKSVPRPIAGRDRVARFLIAGARQESIEGGYTLGRVDINGQPGRTLVNKRGEVFGVLTLDVGSDESVCAVHIIVNPDKLGRLTFRGHVVL